MKKKLIGLFLAFVLAAIAAVKADFDKVEAPAPAPVAADAGADAGVK